jgi:hypothetical protein
MTLDLTTKTAIEEFSCLEAEATLAAELARTFVRTDDYLQFRHQVFRVLTSREAQLKLGVFEQKGVALLGPAGAGKSRFVEEVIKEFGQVTAASSGCEFGSRIISVIVPGAASVKDTCGAILLELGYDIQSNRDENYLWRKVKSQMKLEKVAALHLDEVQDSGRFKTSTSMANFAKHFRNMMQDREWPVCLILTATLDAKEFINRDPTLTRRLKPIEMRDANAKTEGPLLRSAILQMAGKLNLDDDGLISEPEFIAILIHAGASCFGLAMEIAVDALALARSEGSATLNYSHFAEVYFSRSNSDDENNPFMSDDWKNIDTRKAMDRYLSQKQSRAKSR